MAEENQADEKNISIAKIYIKDFSFESPKTPDVFRANEWSPQTNLNLRSTQSEFEDGVFEVTLTITIDAKDGDQTLFLVEISQAGLFEIRGYQEEELKAVIGSYCPSLLFPYARQAVAAMIQNGGFPEFILQPLNFDALYMRSQQQVAQAESEGEEKH